MNPSQMSRREFWMAGGAGLALAGLTQNAQAADERITPKFDFLFHMEAGLEAPQMVGDSGKGNRIIFVATDGTIEGPKIKATVLSGGGDWMKMRSDGVGELDVRASMKTDDGALIYVHYKGLSHNKTPDGSRYFVTTPRFETSVEKYKWLNNIVAIGLGSSAGPSRVQYDVYAISG